MDIELLKAKIICSKWYQFYLWKRYFFRKWFYKNIICSLQGHKWGNYREHERFKDFTTADGYKFLGKCNCGAVLFDEDNFMGIPDSRVNKNIGIKSG